MNHSHYTLCDWLGLTLVISEVRSPHSDSPNERTRSPPYRATGWSCLVLSDASSYKSGYQRRWSQRHPILHNYPWHCCSWESYFTRQCVWWWYTTRTTLEIYQHISTKSAGLHFNIFCGGLFSIEYHGTWNQWDKDCQTRLADRPWDVLTPLVKDLIDVGKILKSIKNDWEYHNLIYQHVWLMCLVWDNISRKYFSSI